MPVLVAILILSTTGLASQAFAATTITINTDKDVYDHTDIVTITGTVDPVDENEIPISILFVNQYDSIVSIDQLFVNSDGSWSGQIVLNPKNNLQSEDGVYEIRASYGNFASIALSIELTNAVETSEAEGTEVGTAVTGTAVIGTDVTGPSGESFYKLAGGQVDYDETCNSNPAFFANADDDSIVIYLDPVNDGILTVTLHEDLIKPFEDGTFAVIVNNQEMQDFTQVGNTLTIPCVVGTEKIEIHGSWAIPEFGVIAAMILAVAIVSIIVVTAKTKLSLVPRY
ncbi:PEFG-CTERM sorting domain-containing protein [Marine Group I thaumarchaeote]|uniref:PEFG-CTERM sorting domain-containing protein n=1 Tax=Marine Group I thaumarchaeote TaxID=2511932 RepID=A0A7K4NTV4_9ARCH|nr:PEFG-CTERM sorting domain-containing protein [Marine Group I thaumarchaeote]